MLRKEKRVTSHSKRFHSYERTAWKGGLLGPADRDRGAICESNPSEVDSSLSHLGPQHGAQDQPQRQCWVLSPCLLPDSSPGLLMPVLMQNLSRAHSQAAANLCEGTMTDLPDHQPPTGHCPRENPLFQSVNLLCAQHLAKGHRKQWDKERGNQRGRKSRGVDTRDTGRQPARTSGALPKDPETVAASLKHCKTSQILGKESPRSPN